MIKYGRYNRGRMSKKRTSLFSVPIYSLLGSRLFVIFGGRKNRNCLTDTLMDQKYVSVGPIGNQSV